MTPRAHRLASSTSPYLLQHARNPVEWFPWGPEAFAEARRRDVPIFLSIGYSTCYWCHVMERESFESEAIGLLLSERFVCIKVDREERPDVDDLYMQATLAVRGQGGWPMSVFLDPSTLRPFWCATYLPPQPRHGMTSLPEVAEAISHAWRSQRDNVRAQADAIADAVAEAMLARPEPVPLGVGHVTEAVSTLLRMYDRQHGGFGRAPKFPQPVYLDLLLEVRAFAGSGETVEAIDAALRHTLDRMAVGGLFDQVGGGFHRYCVDAHWTVPHFEKMLYDNALLAGVYARAATLYNDPFYTRLCTRTLDFLLREMRAEGGGFASALDAEVDHREGLNYLWSPAEIAAALPEREAAIAAEIYGVARGPNFQDPHRAEDPPRNVLRLDDRPERLADRLRMTPAELADALRDINAGLYVERLKRKQPHRDDKVLAGWNGLAIGALAEGHRLTGDARYAQAAFETALHVLRVMRDPQGRLLRSSRGQHAHTPAFLEDYAFLIDGLLRLAKVGDETTTPLVNAAMDLYAKARDLFRDADGSWFDAGADAPDLFARPSSTHDGALPSAISATLNAMLDLHERTGDDRYAADAVELIGSLSGIIAAAPAGCANAVRALMRLLASPTLRDSLVARGMLGEPAAPTSSSETHGPASSADVVEVYAGRERIEVREDLPGVLELLVKITDGYHVVAAEPGEEWDGSLSPFRVDLHDGEGLAIYADYPPGESFAAPGTDRPLRVYRGTFELKALIERTGTVRGRPLVTVSFQACSDTECRRPSIVELDVAIDVP